MDKKKSPRTEATGPNQLPEDSSIENKCLASGEKNVVLVNGRDPQEVDREVFQILLEDCPFSRYNGKLVEIADNHLGVRTINKVTSPDMAMVIMDRMLLVRKKHKEGKDILVPVRPCGAIIRMAKANLLRALPEIGESDVR